MAGAEECQLRGSSQRHVPSHLAGERFLQLQISHTFRQKLVGGFKHLDYCPFHIWDVIRNPLTFMFLKMVKTTKHIYIYILTVIHQIITININHILILYYQPHLSPGEIAAVGKARPRTRENGGARERSSSLGRTGERMQLGLSMATGHSCITTIRWEQLGYSDTGPVYI